MGTTSEKLTYLNTTKTLIKDNLNLGGANISTEPFRAYSSKLKGIYKDFLAHGVDVLWNNWEKVSGSGETLSLTPTIKGKMEIGYKGNTQQNGTPTPDTPIPVQVVSGDNTIKVANGDNTEYEEYPISLGNIELCKIGDYQDKIAKSTGKNLLDLNRTLGQPSDTTASNTTKRKFNYNEVVKGISGSNYYYPQFVTSYNIQNQTISMTTGTTATYSLGFPIKIKANTTYTMSFDKSSAGGRVQVSYYASDGTYINYESKSASFTFTTPSNCDFILINFTGTGTNTTYTFTNCILNEGSTALPYEPYGKVWYLNKQIGKVVLDGTQTNNGYANYGNNKRFVIVPTNYTNEIYYNGSTTNALFSNITPDFNKVINNPASATEICSWCHSSGIMINITPSYNITNVSEMNSWLSNHNSTVYYALKTPTYEEITDNDLIIQLEALAYSYEGTTNISQVNDDMPFVLDITALKEMS